MQVECTAKRCGVLARSLLRGDMIGADHLAPQFDFALEQFMRRLRAFFVLPVQIHAAVAERLAQLGISERHTKRTVQFFNDRPRRRGRSLKN